MLVTRPPLLLVTGTLPFTPLGLRVRGFMDPFLSPFFIPSMLISWGNDSCDSLYDSCDSLPAAHSSSPACSSPGLTSGSARHSGWSVPAPQCIIIIIIILIIVIPDPQCRHSSGGPHQKKPPGPNIRGIIIVKLQSKQLEKSVNTVLDCYPDLRPPSTTTNHNSQYLKLLSPSISMP